MSYEEATRLVALAHVNGGTVTARQVEADAPLSATVQIVSAAARGLGGKRTCSPTTKMPTLHRPGLLRVEAAMSDRSVYREHRNRDPSSLAWVSRRER